MKSTFVVGLIVVLSLAPAHAGLLDFLGLGRKSTNQTSVLTTSSLTQDQIAQGLKQALAQGVQQAVAELGHENGFLTNLNVRIPMPEKLQTVEKTLRFLKQDKLADEFVSTMNHAAEKAVPQAAGVFAGAVQKMTIEDAREILMGTNNAATQYFRRTTETNLYDKFLPIVRESTAETGVTAAYKNLLDKAAGTSFGSFGRSLLGADAMDLDSYITNKALDGLFLMVAEEEQRIRENPAARTTELLHKVFGAITKK